MIKDLPIDINARLTADVKKQLMLVINDEFANKESLYHQVQEAEEGKIVASYRKTVGFDKLKAKYTKAIEDAEFADARKKAIELDIRKLGLDTEGELAQDQDTFYYQGERVKIDNQDAKALKKKIETMKRNAPSQNLKAKLIARLMLATTVGEATTIMREVLGNGIIPATDVKAITFQE